MYEGRRGAIREGRIKYLNFIFEVLHVLEQLLIVSGNLLFM